MAVEVGSAEEKITVSADALHVETTSSQMGGTSGEPHDCRPACIRSYTDLLALQPGVAPTSSGWRAGTTSALPGLPSLPFPAVSMPAINP